jgi:hypothetical protein
MAIQREATMSAITVRNLPPAVVKAVKEKAHHLAGSWSEQEYEQFMSAVREQRQAAGTGKAS